MRSDSIYDILIIGAGASGLMAAVSAARHPGLRIALAEKEAEPARKLYATGNGRCNYLNKNACPSDYYSRGMDQSIPRAVSSIMTEGRIDALTEVFRTLGVEPFEDEAGRMYPRSMQAKSVVMALIYGALSAGAELCCGFDTVSVRRQDGVFIADAADGRRLMAKKLILATGGKAGIQYGCTGAGYKIARSLGHNIIKPIPALTQLLCEDDMQELAGVRAAGRISLIACSGDVSTISAEDSGEIQFTKEGLSGICTFNVSRFYSIEEDLSYKAELDLLEEYSQTRLREMMLERRLRFKSEAAPMILNGMLPEKLAAYIIKKAGITDGMTVGNIDSRAAEHIALLCKSLSFDISGTKSWKDAQVTAGGVDLSEIRAISLESKFVPGLYMCGELLDVDGPCGGYNLSWAFASGWTAGACAAAIN